MVNKIYLGIDVGGTNIKGVLVDVRHRVLDKFIFPTPKNKKKFLDMLEKIILTSDVEVQHRMSEIGGIGVCLPGIVDIKKGILIKAPNLPFLNNWNARKFFERLLVSVAHRHQESVKIAFDNDARCFLRAEAMLGAGKNYKNIVAMTVGTGIGGGIMIDGKIDYGKNFSAGEVGKVIIKKGKTLEQLKDNSEIIGIGVANLINIFAPEIVVLGGGGIVGPVRGNGFPGNPAPNRMTKIRKTAKKHIFSPLNKNTPIVKSKLGIFSSAIGASLLMFTKV